MDPHLSFSSSPALALTLAPKGERWEGALRVGGAEDEHGAVGHHGFARLTLLLFLLLLLHLLLLLFDLCLLQGTGFSISLVANCKRNMLKSSETLPPVRMVPFVSHGDGIERRGRGQRNVSSQVLCKHWGCSLLH